MHDEDPVNDPRPLESRKLFEASEGIPADDAASRLERRLDELRRLSSSPDRYQVGEVIDSGGMGTIRSIVDTSLHRELAMKLLREDRSEGEGFASGGVRAVARFLEEAQVTGQLEHPGVVPVHDLGVDEQGRVYFTMKRVRGRALSEVFADYSSGDPQWPLTRCLGLILRACDAVTYAHDKGILHRDLKPSNIMVGDYGEVYVMDWGLARILGTTTAELAQVRSDRQEIATGSEDSLLTRHGDFGGTPHFMSPEQASGSIDELTPASDVYSMGVVLYQLLSGALPYAETRPRPGESPSDAIRRRVLAERPRPVETLRPGVPAELVAVCERAMQRDPANRYEDMGALRADLGAYLEGRVVQAHETGPVAELRKWVRRNRPFAISMGTAAALLLAGSFSTATLWRRAEGQAQVAQAAAERERAEAERARQAGVVADRTTRFLVELYADASPLRSRGRIPDARDLLDAGARRLSTELPDDPQARASLQSAMGEAYFHLGEYSESERLLREVLEETRRQHGDSALETLIAERELGYVLGLQGSFEEGEKLLRHALAGLEELQAPASEIGTALGNLGSLLRRTGQLEDSLDLTERAIALFEPRRQEFAREWLTARAQRAGLQKEQGDLELAEAGFRSVLEDIRRHLPADHPDLVVALNNLGNTLRSMSRLPEAEQSLRAAHELGCRVLGPLHVDTLTSLTNWSYALSRQGRHQEAYELLSGVAEDLRRSIGLDHPLALPLLDNLAKLHTDRGEWAEAARLFEQILESQRKIYDEGDLYVLQTLASLATTRYQMGDSQGAERRFREAVELYDRHAPQDHPGALAARQNLGAYYSLEGRYEEAIPYQQAAVEGLLRTEGDSVDALRAWLNLAQTHREAHQLVQAQDILDEVDERGQHLALPVDHPLWLHHLEVEVDLRIAEGLPDEAAELATELLEMTDPTDARFTYRQSLLREAERDGRESGGR